MKAYRRSTRTKSEEEKAKAEEDISQARSSGKDRRLDYLGGPNRITSESHDACIKFT